MATWGLHMRIAERLLDLGYAFDEASFVVGNIGADCGMPNEDWSQFTPPTEVSHWTDGGKSNIKPERFVKAHIDDRTFDDKEKAFLIGYYVHLLTDLAFTQFLKREKSEAPCYKPLKQDPQFIWTIKKDWYDLDHKYFRDNPDNIFSRTFQHVKNFPDYLDYYPKGAIQRQVAYITDYYLNPSEDLDRDYIYLREDEMYRFLDTITEQMADKVDALLTRIKVTS